MPIDTSGLSRAFKKLGEQFEYKDPVYRAEIISDDDDNSWTVDFLNPDGTKGARRAVKGTGNYWPGLIVRISRDRKLWGPDYWVIMGADVSGYGTGAPDPTVALHGWTHGFYQPDETTNLATFQIYSLRVQPADPTDLTVDVMAGIYYAGDAFHYLDVITNENLAAFVAALGLGERQYLVLSIDDTVTINITAGTPKVGALDASDIPTPPVGERALCAVDVRNGDTVLERERMYADLRWLAGGVPVDGTFLDLTDTPATYAGQADLVPAVNVGQTALEFVDLDARYLRLDASNDPVTAGLEVNAATTGEPVLILQTTDDNAANPMFEAQDSVGASLVDIGATGAINVNTITGIDFNPGGDIDADLITVGVAGAPRLYWDESQDGFRNTHNIIIDGRVAIGATISATALFRAIGADNVNTGFLRVLQFAHNFSPTGNFNTTVYGIDGQINLLTAQARTGGQLIGLRGSVFVAGGIAATNLVLIGAELQADVEDAAATTAHGIRVYTPVVDTGSCATGYGIEIKQGTVGAGSITNSYGLNIQSLNAGNNNWAIRTGTGLNQLGDRLMVDQSSVTGAAPVLLLDQADVSEEFINFTIAGDQDMVLAKLSVTGNPTLSWDESEDAFNLSHGLTITDGDLIFVGTAGLQFAEIYVEGIDDGIGLAAQDTYYQVTSWSTGGAGINGESNGAVPDVTNDHITITKEGMYLVTWNVSCYSAQKNEYEFEIFTNNGAVGYPNTESYRTTSVASAVGAISGSGICDFAVNDTVELWVERKDGLAVAKTITIRAANINVTQIGGT